jgi:hypothetical protein
MKISKIVLSDDMTRVEDFAKWINENYPYIEVEIGNVQISQVDGKDCNYCGDTRLFDMECMYLDTSPFEPYFLHREENRDIDIKTTFDGIWKATSMSSMGVGFGDTPEHAIQMLLHVIAKRRLWWFKRVEPNFEGLEINVLVKRKILDHGIYTTNNLKSLNIAEAYVLDYALNAKNRIVHLWESIQHS